MTLLDTQMRPGSLPMRTLAVPSPWQAVLISTDGFPDHSHYNAATRSFLYSINTYLVDVLHLKQTILLQVWKLAPGTGAEIVNEHIHDWLPTLGAGIWPDRDPPRGWTDEAMSDATAAVLRGDEIPLVSHKLLHLAAEESARVAIADTLRGLGVLSELFSEDDFAQLIHNGREAFLPTIREKRFRRARFYLPVLDIASLGAAHDAKQLETWTCGASAYTRESAEDKGILLLWRSDHLPTLAPWLDKQFPDNSAT